MAEPPAGRVAIRLDLFDSSHLAAFAAMFDDPAVGRFTRLPDGAPSRLRRDVVQTVRGRAPRRLV